MGPCCQRNLHSFLCWLIFGNGPNTVSGSPVSNTELSKFFFGSLSSGWSELSESLSAYYLCANTNSPSFWQNSLSLPQNSVSSLLRNSTLETVFRPIPRSRARKPWKCKLWTETLGFSRLKVPNSRFALHGRRPSLIHGLCAFFASNSRFMRLFQAALGTCLDSPFFASLSVHGLHFTVYAPAPDSWIWLVFFLFGPQVSYPQRVLLLALDQVVTGQGYPLEKGAGELLRFFFRSPCFALFYCIFRQENF